MNEHRDNELARARRVMREAQTRIVAAAPTLTQDAKELLKQLQRRLLRAQRAELLLTSQAAIIKLVRMTEPTASKHGNFVYSIEGGPKDNTRLASASEKQRLMRADGAVVHFFVVVEQESRQLVVLAYHFEIYWPSSEEIMFIRYDLNGPGTSNEQIGLRSHFHPSDDDASVPSAIFSPLELLDFLVFLYRV
jgi:hypothetical protein